LGDEGKSEREQEHIRYGPALLNLSNCASSSLTDFHVC
jgi:hypothetical protein